MAFTPVSFYRESIEQTPAQPFVKYPAFFEKINEKIGDLSNANHRKELTH
jgi:hypothetical protein